MQVVDCTGIPDDDAEQVRLGEVWSDERSRSYVPSEDPVRAEMDQSAPGQTDQLLPIAVTVRALQSAY